MKKHSFLLLAALTLAACGDRGPVEPSGAAPQQLIVDGAQNGGNPHFFFLAPLVKDASWSGDFNPDLAPAARVCAGSDVSCLSPLGEWSGADVRVSMEDEHYALSWTTGAFARDPGVVYRLEVLVGEAVLGSLEVVFAASQKDAKAVEADGYLSQPLNAPVPVRFRIEQGAVAHALDLPGCEVDCVEATFEPGVAESVTTPSGQAAVAFSETALEEGAEPLVVSISRIILAPGETCLPTDLEQYEGCYRVTASREIEFEPGTVVVGVCLDPSADDDRLELMKVEEDDGDAYGEVQRLEQRNALAYLDCPPEIAFGGSDHPLARLARAALEVARPVTSLLAPRALYAYDGGMGCDPGSSSLDGGFSRFGWARPVAMESVEGDQQSGVPGSTLPIAPKVRVWDVHPDPDEPAADVSVTFTFIGAGPQPDTTIVVQPTDAAGYASVPWILGALEGTYTVVASAPGTNIHAAGVPTAVFTAAAAYPIGLVSHWTAEGGTADVLGNNSIDVTGTFGFSSASMEGSYSFSFAPGVLGGIVSTANGLGSTAVSMAAWIRLDSGVGLCDTNQFIEIVGAGEFRYDSCTNEPYRIHYFGGPGPDLSVQNVLDSGSGCWYHVAVSDGPVTRTMYVNGTAIQTVNRNAGALDPSAIKISENSGEGWVGLIDDVRIWNGEVSATEISALYQLGAADRCPS